MGTVEECLRDIAEAPDEGLVSLACPFQDISDDVEDVVGGNCVVFSMTPKVARALCVIQSMLDDDDVGVHIDFPPFLSVGVRPMCGSADEFGPLDGVTALGVGNIDDQVVGDDGCYPDDVSIVVSDGCVSLLVGAEDADGERHVAKAEMPHACLLDETRKAARMSRADTERTIAEIFEGASSPAPGE